MANETHEEHRVLNIIETMRGHDRQKNRFELAELERRWKLRQMGSHPEFNLPDGLTDPATMYKAILRLVARGRLKAGTDDTVQLC
ncbi:hypothetical protein KBD34_04205 [Patescibacteria group bacterium]|nr:hypothetical protein [Patescibacteria group bacterium]